MHLAETYREVRAQRRDASWLRPLARDVALTGLGALDRLRRRDEWLRLPRVQVVYIHHVFQDEEQPFRRIVEWLVRDHVPIGYSEAVARIRTGDIDRPYVAFSSDDGLHNILVAARILEEFGARMCAFVCTDMVGEDDPATIERFCAERIYFPPCQFLDWPDLEGLLARGHEVGSHTRSHLELSVPGVAELQDEIAGSRTHLEQRLGHVRHFAFPYGRFRHFSSRARDVVFRSGYESCASAERGCHVPMGRAVPSEEMCVRRDHVLAAEDCEHVKHFLIDNARRACPSNSLYPF